MDYGRFISYYNRLRERNIKIRNNTMKVPLN
jgi:hypothetical protein